MKESVLTCAKILLFLLDFQNLFFEFFCGGEEFFMNTCKEKTEVLSQNKDYAFVNILWKSRKRKNKGSQDRNRARKKDDRMRFILGEKKNKLARTQ